MGFRLWGFGAPGARFRGFFKIRKASRLAGFVVLAQSLLNPKPRTLNPNPKPYMIFIGRLTLGAGASWETEALPRVLEQAITPSTEKKERRRYVLGMFAPWTLNRKP